MDQTSPVADPLLHAAPLRNRPQLALVEARFRLAHPAEEVPQDWCGALDSLLGWLGIDAQIVPDAPMSGAPVFAPWTGWSPSAFQHGGLGRLPEAQFVVSYLIDHPRAAPPGLGGLDLMLISPHPATCLPEASGAVAVPDAGVLAAMIRAAHAQRRERIAIILTARQREIVAARLLGGGGAVTDGTTTPDILSLEQALPALMSARAPWDAVIAMPELRSTMFTLLGRASEVCRAWPMLWFGGGESKTLRLVTSEVPGEGMSRLTLDAAALIHTLALTLHAAGAEHHAALLHEGWALLRDSGVTTAGHGQGVAPYTSEVSDSDFIAMLCRGGAVSKRPQQAWRALFNDIGAGAASQPPRLRVVA